MNAVENITIRKAGESRQLPRHANLVAEIQDVQWENGGDQVPDRLRVTLSIIEPEVFKGYRIFQHTNIKSMQVQGLDTGMVRHG